MFKRCGCTDPISGRQLGTRCPQLSTSDHGSWYYAVQLSTVGGRRARHRRGGYPTREAALAARQAMLDARTVKLGVSYDIRVSVKNVLRLQFVESNDGGVIAAAGDPTVSP